MNLQQYLTEQGFKINDVMSFDNQGEIILSTGFVKNQTFVIIDHLSIFETQFDYKRYCQKQNEWMKQYDFVYRFVENDLETAKLFLEYKDSDVDYNDMRTFNREASVIDPSPMEYLFEERFADAYGEEAYQYLAREYSIILRNGKTGYIDYALFHEDETFYAIEENGVSYHHPYIIKETKYKDILMKQNSVVYDGGKVFRWDSESIQNPGRIVDEIKEFLGDITKYKIQTALSVQRDFYLYRHQEEHLQELPMIRESGIKASLVVLPTGTGKTQIALEDLVSYKKYIPELKALVLVPTIDLKKQWVRKINENVEIKNNVEVMTYARICHNYKMDLAIKYNYIIVDEAHHSIAPTLRKVIRHYQPGFLLGLTATDKRLDEKQLESIFGEYEVNLDLKEAIEEGVLCQIRAFRLMTNIDLTQVRFNGNDYYSSDLEKNIIVPSRNIIIADTISKYFGKRLSTKCGVVFCVNIAHAKAMAKLLNERGIKAASIDGKDKDRFDKIDQYMRKRIRFLCTCSLLTEGWDAPHTSVIVMARPTMSKVLYTQQLGRGTRNYPSKEALYVIDVVDNYGTFGNLSNRPWSIHSLFGMNFYSPFKNLVERNNDTSIELEILDTIYEQEIKLDPIDIFTMQQLYGNYLSVEQLARELFVSTGTVNNWIRKKRIKSDITIPMGRKQLLLFDNNRVKEIRELMGLREHTEEMIVDDFWKFIEERDYTFSYKMYFILALLQKVDSTGEALVDEVLEVYREFYLERFRESRIIDRKNSPYNHHEYVQDPSYMKRSMLENPFEKFERKRFLYYAKDLKKISIHHRIWDELLKNDGLEMLKGKMRQDLINYYDNIEKSGA